MKQNGQISLPTGAKGRDTLLAEANISGPSRGEFESTSVITQNRPMRVG
jgi:hypothetical protein